MTTSTREQEELGNDIFCHLPSSNIFLKCIMSDALEEHDGKVSICGKNLTNLQFADDTDF